MAALDAILGFLGKAAQALVQFVPAIAGYVFGKRAVRAENTEDALDRQRRRNNVEDRVNRLDPDDLDKLL